MNGCQLYGDYFINYEIRIPIKQPVLQWKVRDPGFFGPWLNLVWGFQINHAFGLKLHPFRFPTCETKLQCIPRWWFHFLKHVHPDPWGNDPI